MSDTNNIGPGSAPQTPSGFACGFVSILGRPNAGKSTLLNALVGAKVAIVAAKPQTTQTVVQGVVSTPTAQIVFLDTPGIHQSKTLLNRRMMESVRSAAADRDLLLFVADAARPNPDDDSKALDLAKKTGAPIVLVLNKIDRVPGKNQLLPLIAAYSQLADFREIVPVSAARGDGLDRLLAVIEAALPKGPPLFPSDHLTDQPERFLAAEMIREKILAETHQEVPHSVAVLVEEWKDEGALTRIAATVYVERDGQKAIIIGARGAALKRIGTAARLDIEHMLERKVFLSLFVKVKQNWRESPEFLNELDWRFTHGG
jgi:GTPase